MCWRLAALQCFIFSILAIAIPENAIAADECGCSAALDANLMDQFELSFGSQAASKSLADYCRTQSTQSGASSSMSAGGSYGAISGNFGQSAASSSASLDAVCDKRFQEGSSEERQKIVSRTVNANLARSYETCVRTCNNKDFGFDIKRNDSGLTMTIRKDVREAFVHSLTVRPLQTAEGVDSAQGVSCYIESNGMRYKATVLGAEPGEGPKEPIKLTSGMPVKVECLRKLVSLQDASKSGKVLRFYPGFNVSVLVGDSSIDEFVLPKPASDMTSVEFDSVQDQLKKLGVIIDRINTRITAIEDRLNRRQAIEITGPIGIFGGHAGDKWFKVGCPEGYYMTGFEIHGTAPYQVTNSPFAEGKMRSTYEYKGHCAPL